MDASITNDDHLLSLAADFARLEKEKTNPDEALRIGDEIISIKAHTPAGMAAQLRILWLWETGELAENSDSETGHRVKTIIDSLTA